MELIDGVLVHLAAVERDLDAGLRLWIEVAFRMKVARRDGVQARGCSGTANMSWINPERQAPA